MQCEQSERFGDFYYLCVNCAGLNNVGGGGERLKILFEAKRKQRGIILLNFIGFFIDRRYDFFE